MGESIPRRYSTCPEVWNGDLPVGYQIERVVVPRVVRDDDECHLYPSCRWALAYHLVIGDECLFIVGVKHALDALCLRRTHNKLDVEINQGLNEKDAIEAAITVDTVDPDKLPCSRDESANGLPQNSA